MNPTIVGVIVFVSTFAGALLAMWLRSTLPEHHLDANTRDTVKTSIGLIATMTALVLGLVTASAKSAFDAVDTTVKQTAAELLALDRVLARYGSEASTIRKGLRDTIEPRIEMIWPQRSSKPGTLETLASATWLVGAERLVTAVQDLKPHNDSQRAFQKRALDLGEKLLAARWLVTDETTASIPVPFMAVLLCWLTIIFASFGLLAPRNVTVVMVLFVCALSVGSALFLILEMDGPFDGLLKVSPAPLRFALEHLNQ